MDLSDLPANALLVLGKLDEVRSTRDGWDARCPCPDHNKDGDQNPSLRVAVGENRAVLLTCRVGCRTDAVLDALGLDWGDLFPDQDQEGAGAREACVPIARCASADGADLDLYHRVYEQFLKQLTLEEGHRAALQRRGLSDGEIDRRLYRSLRNSTRGRAAKAVHEQLGDDILTVPGFVRGQYGITLHGDATGVLVPVRDLQGRIVALKVRQEKEPKYLYLTSDEQGPSPGSPVHVPLGVGAAEVVRITEGELKADVCVALDSTPTMGVPGVGQWRPAIQVLRDLQASTVVLAYDALDVRTKPPVFEQAEALWQCLVQEGFTVEVEDWDE
jgi:hypothetical protein